MSKKLKKQLNKQLAPLHPGEVLREEFIEPLILRRANSPGPASCPAPALSASRGKK